jgi:hypothetical protein
MSSVHWSQVGGRRGKFISERFDKALADIHMQTLLSKISVIT